MNIILEIIQEHLWIYAKFRNILDLRNYSRSSLNVCNCSGTAMDLGNNRLTEASFDLINYAVHLAKHNGTSSVSMPSFWNISATLPLLLFNKSSLFFTFEKIVFS